MFTVLQILLFQANTAVTAQARTLSILWDTEESTPPYKCQYNYGIVRHFKTQLHSENIQENTIPQLETMTASSHLFYE